MQYCGVTILKQRFNTIKVDGRLLNLINTELVLSRYIQPYINVLITYIINSKLKTITFLVDLKMDHFLDEDQEWSVPGLLTKKQLSSLQTNSSCSGAETLETQALTLLALTASYQYQPPSWGWPLLQWENLTSLQNTARLSSLDLDPRPLELIGNTLSGTFNLTFFPLFWKFSFIMSSVTN